MRTAVVTHDACLRHAVLPDNPERPDRLAAVQAALEDAEFADVARHDAPRADAADVARVHDERFTAALRAHAPSEPGDFEALDWDTALSSGTLEAADRGAGAAAAAVDLVMAGEAEAVFCAVRPPGHHAERARAMGFCYFNNIAVAAKRALDVHGLERVAIVDFDVHHGNGSQAVAETDPRILFASIHEGGIYPGTGRADETGPDGNIVNAPVEHFAGSLPWRREFERLILKAVDDFRPDLVFVSAGFDAHAADPLASLQLTEDDFFWATRELGDLADRHSSRRLVSTLEGGYDFEALARSAAAHVRALLDA